MLRFVALVLACLPVVASATAQRTFVRSDGVDNPACSLAAPCRAFAAAIAATSSGGEVIVLDSAGYGPVTITQSASIIAPPGVYAGVSVFTGNGIMVNGSGVDVVLRGLAINGLGGDHGIVVQQAGRVRIENCIVSRMSHMGIFYIAASAAVTVSDTIVRDNAEDGIRMVTGIGSITLERVTIEGNPGNGLYISPNVATGQLDATISDSRFARNGTGIWADAGASASVLASIDRSTLSENLGNGVRVSGSTSAVLRVTVQRSTLRRNNGGINLLGTSPATIVVNASDNVLHHNSGSGILVDGSGAVARVSGNSYDVIVCAGGGNIYTYQNNSVFGLSGSCATLAAFQ